MNRRIKIYLDTSVINFLFADDAPEQKMYTLELFDNFIKTGIYETFISGFVIDELGRTKDTDKKDRLLKVVEDYPIELLDISNTEELQSLAGKYVAHGVIPEKKFYDAYHIACAVICQLDYLVSWNFKHLANVNRERKVLTVNVENNYLYPLRIITPLELIDYED